MGNIFAVYQYDVVSTISPSSLFMYMLFGLLSLATHQGDALVMEESNTVNKPAEPMVSDSGRPLGQAFEDVAHTQEDGRLIITNLCSGS